MSDLRQVQGLSELLKVMKALPPAMVSTKGGPVRHALMQPARIVRDRARELAPKRTGNLAANIIMKRDRDPKWNGANERYIVAVRKKHWTEKSRKKAVRNASGGINYKANGDAYYWHYVEFGTEKMAAEPFLRPAFETTKDEQIDAFKTDLADGVRQLVQQLGGK